MGDDKKLKRLKEELTNSLRQQARYECIDLQITAHACKKKSWFSICTEEQEAFIACYKTKLQELKKANEDVLRFEIKKKK